MTPSILTRKAIVGSSEAGASSTARLNAEISFRTAGRELSVAFTGQIGIPSEVSALRSDLRSASRQISQASASPVASKTSVGVPLISSVKICDGPVNARFIVIDGQLSCGPIIMGAGVALQDTRLQRVVG